MKVKKPLMLVSIIILVSAMVGAQYAIPAGAKAPEITYDSTYHYTLQVGQLGGATYEIFMPDNWNGHLVIGCKGYALSTDPLTPIDGTGMHTVGLQFMTSTATARFAYATSTYGTTGFCMQVGMIRTHQLTQYIIDNFHVTGKTFLIGFSMGGQIALMLAHKYPDLYAGVLDVCGNKDTKAFYNYWRDLTNLPATGSAVRTYLNGAPTYLPVAFTNYINDAACLNMQIAAAQIMDDLESEFGGTPESKPQAYNKLSPTCNPELTVPVISMVARLDYKVPIQHFNDYYGAVQETGCMDYYRCYRFPAMHCDNTMMANVQTYFQKLFDWATGIQVPPATPKPYP